MKTWPAIRALRSAPALVLAALVLSCLAWLCLQRPGDPSGPRAPAVAPEPARYVGSQDCEQCHASEYKAWASSQHHRAMQAAAGGTVLAPFAGERFEDSLFIQRDGHFFVRTAGGDGKPAEFEISHTMGLAPLQQYLVSMPNGSLQALDIAWDTRAREQGGQRWFHLQGKLRAKPGDELHWTGRQYNANFMCLDCHTTGFQKGFDPDVGRFASRWRELGVACEACHGPGSNHLAWARSGPSQLPGSDKGLTVVLQERNGVHWKIDPASGMPRRSPAPSTRHKEIDLCARCHSHRSQIADTPAAGAPLLDSHLPSLLSPDLFWSDGQVRAEVYNYASFLQSRMAQRGVTCSDCHEVHGQKLRVSGNGVCAQCHAPQRFEQAEHLRHASGSRGAQCVACHMPTETFMQIDPRHDHAIRVPRPDASLRFGTPNACSQCHADKSVRWAAEWARRWYPGLGERPLPLPAALRQADGDDAEAQQRLIALLGNAQTPDIVRATALARLPVSAIPPAQLAAALHGDDALLRHSAVEALAAAPVAERARILAPMLDDPVKAVRIDAARGLAGAPAGLLEAHFQERLRDGLNEYIAVQRYNADRPEAWNNLGTLQAELGDLAAAEASLRRALALAPVLAVTSINLADVVRLTGRETEAQAILKSLVKREPGNAVAWHALGLSLLRQGRMPAALQALHRAADLDPPSQRNAYVYALALEAAGKGREALTVLEAALHLHSGDRELLQALIACSRKQGDEARAEKYLGQLSRSCASQVDGAGC